MLDYRVKVFQVVAEQLNFTRAAEKLHISQPSVTQHIKALEEHYGTHLFRRTAGRVTLTPAGSVLLAAVERAAALEREVETQLRDGQPSLSGPLRIGASMTIAQYFLPAMLAQFQLLHPKIELTLRIGNTRDVADGVRATRLDLGLVEGPGERRDLQAQAFFKDEIVCVAGPNHPLLAGPRLTPETLAQACFVLREPGSGTRDVVERALEKVGVSLQSLSVFLETDSSEVIKRLVEAGPAVAFLSRLAIVSELALGKLFVLPVENLEIQREFFFLSPQGPKVAGAAGAFSDFIAEQATGKI